MVTRFLVNSMEEKMLKSPEILLKKLHTYWQGYFFRFRFLFLDFIFRFRF